VNLWFGVRCERPIRQVASATLTALACPQQAVLACRSGEDLGGLTVTLNSFSFAGLRLRVYPSTGEGGICGEMDAETATRREPA
jgi:hypothetical protein